jgi:hypothetical protein
MNSLFYDCVNKSMEKFGLSEKFDIDMSKSILMDRYQDQIAVFVSEKLKVGFVLDKEQVNFLITSLSSTDWFSLSSLTIFLSNGKEDWIFEDLRRPISSQYIEAQMDKLINIFQKYQEQLLTFFTIDNEYDQRIILLRQSMNKRWEERSAKLAKKRLFWFL